MTDQRTPSADEVRALVRRIVDQTLDADPAAAPVAAPAEGRVAVAIAGDHGGWQHEGRHRRLADGERLRRA